MKDLTGKVAVVTGAASGIGRGMARQFVLEGMRVVLADVEKPALDDVLAELRSLGGDVVGQITDVSQWEDVAQLADRSIDAFGQVNVVCNNAGVIKGGPIEQVDLDVWRWVIDVNLWGVIHGVRAFLPLIEAAGEGHVVNTSSALGLYTMPYQAPYSATKFAVAALTEVLAQELAARDSPIKVTCLCPGSTKSMLNSSDRNLPARLVARGLDTAAEDAAFQEMAMRVKEKSGLEPDDVARRVIAAIRDETFWLVTHHEIEDMARGRADAIADGHSLFATARKLE